jgi:hypothetical protein
MPSKSKKQHRFMQAAAHNPAFAKEAGIAPSVAREFTAADKRVGKFQGKIRVAGRHPGRRKRSK